MAETPQSVRSVVVDGVMSDLRPSHGIIYLKSGIAVVVGGFLSLFGCGQFGVAATSPAQHVHNHLHQNVQGLACVLLCGFLFAVLPALILRLICSPLQFRAITRKSLHAPLVWLVSMGAMLAYHGDQGHGVINFAIWCAAAWATFEGISKLLELGLTQMQKRQLRAFP